jgi:hypothetical protein
MENIKKGCLRHGDVQIYFHVMYKITDGEEGLQTVFCGIQ